MNTYPNLIFFGSLRGSHPDPVHIWQDPKLTGVVGEAASIKRKLFLVVRPLPTPSFFELFLRLHLEENENSIVPCLLLSVLHTYIYSIYLYTNAPLPKNSTSVPHDLMKPFKTGLLERFLQFSRQNSHLLSRLFLCLSVSVSFTLCFFSIRSISLFTFSVL